MSKQGFCCTIFAVKERLGAPIILYSFENKKCGGAKVGGGLAGENFGV